ncbi:hypothetical protein DMB38_24925 [Streptomyces sp. WAC 06738]|uniref:hypothetical protein n=1 Tax=Streptomyces sp. WAC 06738 TaxID=2203210 RepID=UPI000F6C75B8|nr:hypothetical protein [Streptomyces sp. WAC 06738]AZM48598.1 hypothetical protein DMB38_24925 [Streptomyces sp. WAC 06738]
MENPLSAKPDGIPSAAGSAVRLPDFSDVDVYAVAARGEPPVLAGAVAHLLRNWPSDNDAGACFENGPPDAGQPVTGGN